jgi:glycerol-3-phosphate dehydrogenase
MDSNICIVGGGIVGTFIARELSKYKLKTVLVEKETDSAFGGSTKANTGIIHAGYDDIPGTLKAKLCVRGNRLWPKVCYELGIPFKNTGSLVIAFNEDENTNLLQLKKRGEKNGVPSLKMIESRNELQKIEPNLNHKASSALYAPTAGITSSYEAAIALAENSVQNDVKILFDTEVTDLIIKKDTIKGVKTDQGDINLDYVINAAGLFSDKISAMAGIDDFVIKPVKGEYFVFDKILNNYVKHVLFPVPSQISKGIVVTQTIDGNLLIGPNANKVDNKTDLTTTNLGLKEIIDGSLKLIPKLQDKRNMIINNFAGLRAESNTDDFIIKAYDEPRGFINVAGIKSPGLTSAPAIAVSIVDLLKHYDLKMEKKEKFDPYRRPIIRSIEMLQQNEIQKLLKKDSCFGHIVCRCEHVSEGEVIEALKRGAKNLDGIKFRTRAGMGRCQGGFCTPHLIKILSRELDIKVEEITKCGESSKILPYKIKHFLS